MHRYLLLKTSLISCNCLQGKKKFNRKKPTESLVPTQAMSCARRGNEEGGPHEMPRCFQRKVLWLRLAQETTSVI